MERAGACAVLRSARNRSVNAEGLPEPEDSQQEEEHQRKNGGGLRNLGTARLAPKLSEMAHNRRHQATILNFQQIP